MPKETKKFINPLLRPSQDVTPKDTSTTKSTVTEEMSTQTSPTTTEPEQPVPTPVPEPIHSAPATETSSLESTPSDDIYIKERIAPRRARSTGTSATTIATDEPIVEERKTAPLPSPVLTNEVDEPQPTHNTVSPPLRSTRSKKSSPQPSSPSSYTELPNDTDLEDALDTSKFIETYPSYDIPNARSVSRRKRTGQTFENIHERITLWIDKRLKQAFDDLAYEEDLSKTALINEAVSDLLKKYNAN